MNLAHGGNLAAASRAFRIPRGDWIDLSTGISPWSWPVPTVPDAVWQRLPEDGDELPATAAQYYHCDAAQLLAVPGSQHAIRALPALWPAATVALPAWGYREHHLAWQGAGHRALIYRDFDDLRALVANGAARHALVINPNNPSSALADPAELVGLAATLAARGGQLVVDEAFMDPQPQLSLIPHRPGNALVLRSLGKFFGLAGVRLGFVVAEPHLLERLAAAMNPWAVSHPARWAGAGALADRAWQAHQRRRLDLASRAWLATLAAVVPALRWRQAALFISAECTWRYGEALFRAAGAEGLLVRLAGPVAGRGTVRLGLPGDNQLDEAKARLQRALERLTCEIP